MVGRYEYAAKLHATRDSRLATRNPQPEKEDKPT
jgi:hypothetical protein